MDDDLLGRFIAWCELPESARAQLAGWEPVPLVEGDQLAAVALLRGTEIHFAAAPAWRRRLIQRGRTRAFLAPLMARRGFLTTRTVPGPHGRFLERLGFVPTWTEGPITHWMLTALPFGAKES